MFVPLTYAQPAAPAVPLIPIEIAGASPGALPAITGGSPSASSGTSAPPELTGSTAAVPVHTRLVVRNADLNVLAGSPTTVSGALLADPRAESAADSTVTGATVAGATVAGATVAGATAAGATAADPGGVGPGGVGSRAGAQRRAGSPGLSGRTVSLQVLGPRGWRTVASTRTGRNGAFRVRYVPPRIGSRRIRLRFAGTQPGGTDLASRRPLGLLNVYRLADTASTFARHYTVTSTCYDGGTNTADGSPVHIGIVANNFLPFHTRIELDHAVFGRRVYTVDDRIGSGSELDIYNPSEAACDQYGRETIGFRVLP